jgi:hypothetical protein
VQRARVDPRRPLRDLLPVLFNQVLVEREDVLPLVVVDQVQLLKGGDHVLLLNRSLKGEEERDSQRVSNYIPETGFISR